MTLQTRFLICPPPSSHTPPSSLLSSPAHLLSWLWSWLPCPWLCTLFFSLSFLSLLKSGCKLHLNSKERKETQDLTTNVFGVCKGFFPPTETVFYLNKRVCVLFSSESVFKKFYVMFPWMSGERFRAQIICAIEQAEKKIPKRANLFIHSPCLQRQEEYPLCQAPF